jgi:hypothetical protein
MVAGAAHAADAAVLGQLDLQRAGGGTVVRTGGVADLGFGLMGVAMFMAFLYSKPEPAKSHKRRRSGEFITGISENELSPHLPRGQFRRCAEARRPGPADPSTCRRRTGFRVLDTHAGIGLYDLSSEEAQKTGEWRDGIGKLLKPSFRRRWPIAGALSHGRPRTQSGWRHALLSRFAEALAHAVPPAGPAVGDGTASRGFRGCTACSKAITMPASPSSTAGWRSARICRRRKSAASCWSIRPSRRTANTSGWSMGWPRPTAAFPGGTYCLWYPLKKGAPIKEFHEALQALDIPKMLCAELTSAAIAASPA